MNVAFNFFLCLIIACYSCSNKSKSSFPVPIVGIPGGKGIHIIGYDGS